MLTFKSHKKVKSKYEIVCHDKPSLFDRMFGDKERDRTFVGNSTVWHELPSWNRCNTNIESVLSSFHSKIKYEEETSDEEKICH